MLQQVLGRLLVMLQQVLGRLRALVAAERALLGPLVMLQQVLGRLPSRTQLSEIRTLSPFCPPFPASRQPVADPLPSTSWRPKAQDQPSPLPNQPLASSPQILCLPPAVLQAQLTPALPELDHIPQEPRSQRRVSLQCTRASFALPCLPSLRHDDRPSPPRL